MGAGVSHSTNIEVPEMSRDCRATSRRSTARLLAGLAALCLIPSPVMAQDKPNILIIWGDHLGR